MDNLSGDDLVSPQWISFVPVSCKDGYLTYNYTNTQICLKYVSTPCTYPEATGYCQADGGDLIRLDSQLKHEIATDYLLPIANGSTIDVWIQGTKVGNDWFFHDGSKMPEDFDAICPLALDNNVNETHLRVHGSSTFPCWDMVPTLPLSDGCTTYNLTSHQICLKYFPVPARYSSARNLCQAEGGDLIKIDSQEKYDKFETFHVPIANNTLIEVWVQGEKIEGQWKFDDGTPIPNFCPITTGTNPGEILSCKDGYLTYNYTNTQICLKYVSTPSTYLEATEYCQADGGDLIRLDSKRKHDIVTDYLLPIANGSTIDVLIQGTKERNEWFFHDGSKMPEDFDAICPLALNNNVNEKHLRVHGSSTFSCWDMVPIRRYSFLCEQYHKFTIYE
uniref:C-type lectin domain-containing protein n=1 Tax=Magallana gigas TaxID=29159 RepID=K1QEB5_MAGGI